MLNPYAPFAVVPLISFVTLMLKRSQSNQKGCDEECEGVESLLHIRIQTEADGWQECDEGHE